MLDGRSEHRIFTRTLLLNWLSYWSGPHYWFLVVKFSLSFQSILYTEEIWFTQLIFSQPPVKYPLHRGPLSKWDCTKQSTRWNVRYKTKLRIVGAEVVAVSTPSFLSQPSSSLDQTKDSIPPVSTILGSNFPEEKHTNMLTPLPFLASPIVCSQYPKLSPDTHPSCCHLEYIWCTQLMVLVIVSFSYTYSPGAIGFG